METQNSPEQNILSPVGNPPSSIELRERAREKLGQIKSEVATALTEIGINYPVFILVPERDGAIFYLGTSEDPTDNEWHLVSDTVSRVVEKVLGLRRASATEITSTLITSTNATGVLA